MIYTPAPIEVGVFNAVEADVVADEIVRGEFGPLQRKKLSGRLILPEETHQDVINRIEMLTFADIEKEDINYYLRTRMYAQDFDQIDTDKFTGYSWHIDSDVDGFDFNFGSSRHTSIAFEGFVDTFSIERWVKNKQNGLIDTSKLTASTLLRFCAGTDLIDEAICKSIDEGTGRIIELHEGVLYKMPKDSLHRMREFNPRASYPARFCIEQYLLPNVLQPQQHPRHLRQMD